MFRTGPWILIIQENEQQAQHLAKALGNQGFRVLTCTRPTQAAQMFANQRFSGIILDLDMSRAAAEDVISLVRDDEKGFNRNTPIIAIRESYDVETLKRIGPDVAAAMLKPVDRRELFERLRSICPVVPEVALTSTGMFRFS